MKKTWKRKASWSCEGMEMFLRCLTRGNFKEMKSILVNLLTPWGQKWAFVSHSVVSSREREPPMSFLLFRMFMEKNTEGENGLLDPKLGTNRGTVVCGRKSGVVEEYVEVVEDLNER